MHGAICQGRNEAGECGRGAGTQGKVCVHEIERGREGQRGGGETERQRERESV